jgi:hypothetical protein
MKDKSVPSMTGLRQRFELLKWVIPLALVLLVVVYQSGPAYWIHHALGYTYHLLIETLLFAAVGPLLVFMLLNFMERWLEERDTSDLQAQMLAQLRRDMQKSRQLNDHALQVLFAAGAVVTTLKLAQPSLSAESTAQAEQLEVALNEAVERLRSHLLT